MRDLEARFIAWWRINVSGRLQLGAFFRFVLTQKEIRHGDEQER